MIITAIIIIIALIVIVWIFVELKRFKHKLFAIFLIFLIVFGYVSFVIVFKDKNINWKDPADLKVAGGLYLSWLGSVFGNLKSITTNAVQMDWTSGENQKPDDKKE